MDRLKRGLRAVGYVGTITVLIVGAGVINAQVSMYPPAGAVSGLTSSGTLITSTLPILFPAGSAGAPSIAFADQATTGIHYASSEVYFNQAGVSRWLYGATQLRMRSDFFFGWSSSTVANSADTILGREAAATLQMGQDAATATAQNLKGSDSTGANVTGGNLTLRAGAGTSGNATGGQLVLGGGANAGTGERGAVAIEDGGTKPTCAAGIRGSFWYDAGGAGVADTFEVCAKQAAGDTYAWYAIATIP